MRRLLACLLFFAGPAAAAPAYFFEFETTSSFDCPLPEGAPLREEECARAAPYVASLLDALSITISHDAAIAGFASLQLFHGPYTELESNGVLAVTIPDHAPIDLSDLSTLNGLFGLNFTVDVGLLLRGAYNFGDTEGTIYMTSGPDTTWEGRIMTDRFSWSGGNPLTFEGEWRLTQVIPEPGAIALVLLALVSMATTQKRRPDRVGGPSRGA